MERIQIITNHIIPQQLLSINNTTDAIMELEEEHEKKEAERKIQCEKEGKEYVYQRLNIDFGMGSNNNIKQN